jgi:hypothetical protein
MVLYVLVTTPTTRTEADAVNEIEGSSFLKDRVDEPFIL